MYKYYQGPDGIKRTDIEPPKLDINLDSSKFYIDNEGTTSERIVIYASNILNSGETADLGTIGIENLVETEKDLELVIRMTVDAVQEHNTQDTISMLDNNKMGLSKTFSIGRGYKQSAIPLQAGYMLDNLNQNNYSVKKVYLSTYAQCEHAIPINLNQKQQTGNNDDWKAKNIYDLAGNVEEWTMEKESATESYIARGGKSTNFGNTGFANSRNSKAILSNRTGYRIAMYVK